MMMSGHFKPVVNVGRFNGPCRISSAGWRGGVRSFVVQGSIRQVAWDIVLTNKARHQRHLGRELRGLETFA